MIDSNFIIRYTNGLYSLPPDICPRYDEFRDMFSAGQLKSKQWAIEELGKFADKFEEKSAVVVGAWFGTLGLMLKQQHPLCKVLMLDTDSRCSNFVNTISYDLHNVEYITQDMYEHIYKEYAIINTSCEHIPDLEAWVSLLPAKRLVLLQSNDYREEQDHINCVDSEDELFEKSGLSTLLFKGTLTLPMYSRYMIIGMT